MQPSLLIQAQQVLRDNDAGSYTQPSSSQYPHQWCWDSAFISLGWAAFDVSRAYLELETLAGSQHLNGMIPHIAFSSHSANYLPGPEWWSGSSGYDGRSTSAITQPPVAAIALRIIFEQEARPERARPLVLAFHNWHKFLMTTRDPLGQGEPVLIHPWESGRDNAAEWDRTLQAVKTVVTDFERKDLEEVSPEERPSQDYYEAFLSLIAHGQLLNFNQDHLARYGAFRILDPGFSSILYRACQDLAVVAEALGEGAIAETNHQWATDLEAALKARASSGLAYAVDLAAQEERHYLGAGQALQILLPQSEENLEHLARLLTESSLASDYGVRSLAEEASKWSAVNYWRGPVWANLTWLCALGLESNGLKPEVALLRQRLLNSVQASGFREYFNPSTGAGLGVDSFSWTAALTASLLSAG